MPASFFFFGRSQSHATTWGSHVWLEVHLAEPYRNITRGAVKYLLRICVKSRVHIIVFRVKNILIHDDELVTNWYINDGDLHLYYFKYINIYCVCLVRNDYM